MLLARIPRGLRSRLGASKPNRQRRLSAYQLRTLLGIESRYELDGLLKEHKISLYTLEEVEQDLATNEELRKKRELNSRYDRCG